MNSSEDDPELWPRFPQRTTRLAISQTAPSPDQPYYRFPTDFWDKVGYPYWALEDNRLGRLCEGQSSEVIETQLEQMGIPILVTVPLLIGAFVLLSSQPLGLRIIGGCLLLPVLIGWGSWLREYKRDRREARVDSFCGDLTKWLEKGTEREDPDLYKLKDDQDKITVRLSSRAYDELPKTAHYRIYFTPHTPFVVNAEEHSDDAPHDIPDRDTAAEGS